MEIVFNVIPKTDAFGKRLSYVKQIIKPKKRKRKGVKKQNE